MEWRSTTSAWMKSVQRKLVIHLKSWSKVNGHCVIVNWLHFVKRGSDFANYHLYAFEFSFTGHLCSLNDTLLAFAIFSFGFILSMVKVCFLRRKYRIQWHVFLEIHSWHLLPTFLSSLMCRKKSRVFITWMCVLLVKFNGLCRWAIHPKTRIN